jgi:hypothetical protein
MGDHLNLRGFYPAFDRSRAEERPQATDFFPYSGNKHDILNAHLTGLLEGGGNFPFAQRRQSRKNPMIHVVSAREQ